MRIRNLLPVSLPGLSLISFLLVLPGVLASNYVFTCQKCHMSSGSSADPNGHLLDCLCIGPTKGWVGSTVHLNEMMGNVDGNLRWFSNNYRKTCINYELLQERYYRAACVQVNGHWHGTQIDLNEFITNKQGVLVMDKMQDSY